MKRGETNLKKEKRAGRSKAEKFLDKTKSPSVLASPAKKELSTSHITSSLPSSPFKATLTLSYRHYSNTPARSTLDLIITPLNTPPPNTPHRGTYYKKKFHMGEKSCEVDGISLERHLSSQRKTLLKPLLKVSTVDGRSVEDPRNLPKAYGLITWIWNSGRDLKLWDHLS